MYRNAKFTPIEVNSNVDERLERADTSTSAPIASPTQVRSQLASALENDNRGDDNAPELRKIAENRHLSEKRPGLEAVGSSSTSGTMHDQMLRCKYGVIVMNAFEK